MKSIYLRNFMATAILVTVCFLIISFAFVGIGRQYLISESELERFIAASACGDQTRP